MHFYLQKSQNTLLRLILFGFIVLISSCSTSKNVKIVEKESIEISPIATSDSIVSSMILPYKEDLDIKMSRVLNISEVDLVKGRPESNLGNLVADLSYRIASEMYTPEDNHEIDFCLLNNGGLRTSIAKGPITLGKAFEVMPFENELVVLTLSYVKTMELFDYLAAGGGEPISNAELVIKDSMPFKIVIDGQAPDSTRTYKVLSTDYLARGGDKMYFFLDPLNYENVGIKLRDAIIVDFEEKAEEGELINSKIEGRIRFEE